MRLYASPTSPYARFIRVMLLEKQLVDRVAPIWVDPWDNPAALLSVNPFARVPVLEDDEGTCLSESGVIALYLERRFPEPRLMPLDRVEHVHRKMGVAQGILDAAVGTVVHRRFYPDSDQDALVARRLESLRRALPVAEALVRPLLDRPDLGSLNLAVALGYLDFRLPELAWRNGCERLPGWYETLAARSSLGVTAPEHAQPDF